MHKINECADNLADTQAADTQLPLRPSLLARMVNFFNCWERTRTTLEERCAVHVARDEEEYAPVLAEGGVKLPPQRYVIYPPGRPIPRDPSGPSEVDNEAAVEQGTSEANQEEHLPDSDGKTTAEQSVEGTSPLTSSEQNPTNTDGKKNSGNNDKTKSDDREERGQGSSGPLRDANALCLPEQNEEMSRSPTPHHSELFESFTPNLVGNENSQNWLEYFTENCPDHYFLWN